MRCVDCGELGCRCENEYEEVVLPIEKVEKIIFLFDQILKIMDVSIEFGDTMAISVLVNMERDIKEMIKDLS